MLESMVVHPRKLVPLSSSTDEFCLLSTLKTQTNPATTNITHASPITLQQHTEWPTKHIRRIGADTFAEHEELYGP